MNKNILLSIKEFSQLTKVEPHSLRYYDSLGILSPAYVDPSNGYRYYSLEQRELIFVIQYCVEAGIPLKQVPNYINRDHGVIQYKALMEAGTTQLNRHIQNLQVMSDRWNLVKDALQHADSIRVSPTPLSVDLPELNALIVPFWGNQQNDQFRIQLKSLIQSISHVECMNFISSGLLLKCQDGMWTQFLFTSFGGDPDLLLQDNRFFQIPAGKYLCKEVSESGIEQAWDWSEPFVDRERIELIIETELLVSEYKYVAPPLEQRCLLRK